jgi:arylsulfatase A-like enzyme
MMGPAGMMSVLALVAPLSALLSTGPNLILVTIDTLRADHLGCYGSTLGATPRLDALAAEGVRFEHAVSPVPLTRPAHTSLLTGLYPWEHGVRDNLPAKLDESIPTIASELHERGYDTAAFVGTFLLGRGSGLERGFATFEDGAGRAGTGDRVGAAAERRASEVAAGVLRYLEDAKPPFFLWAHFYDPHAPYEPPEPFAKRFAGNPYAGEIAYVDEQVGAILDLVEKRGLAPSTLVLVTADHGEGLGDHGEDEHGVLVYEETIHVPLLLRFPATVAPGSVEREPVSLVDVAPTLLAAAGRAEGPTLLHPRARPLYFESLYGSLHFGWAPLRGIRDGASKLIFAPRPELFDLEVDPRETQDLSPVHKDEARRLYAELQEVLGKERSTASGGTLSPGDAEKLASLGYTGATSAKQTGADPKDEIAGFATFGRRLREGITRFDRGDWKGAQPIFEELAKRDILSFEVHLYLARCRRLAGDLGGAIREYDAAALIYDDYSLLHLERGRALAQSGDLRAAAAAFRKSLAIAATAEGAVALATAARKLGDVPGAIEALREAVALAPDDADSWNELGAMLLSSDEADAAIAAFEKAVALRPGDDLLRHNLELARGMTKPHR